jgi:PAS domain S-box-containing protein
MSNKSTTNKSTTKAFHNYLDANPNSLILLNFNYDIQFVNQAALYFLKQNGFTASSLKTIFDFITPDYHTVLASALNDVSAIIVNQKEVVATLNIAVSDDVFMVLAIHRFAYQAFSGLQVQVQEYQQDITIDTPLEIDINQRSIKEIFRKLGEQEKKLVASQERYRIISENSHDLVTLYDTNFNFRFVSPSIINHGLVPAEFVGRNFFEVFEAHTKFCEIFKTKIFEPLLSKKVERVGPIVIRRLTDEADKNLELIAKPIYDDNDNLVFILTTEQDVTDKIKAEKRLKASEKKYRLISENMSDVITLNTPSGKITYVSPSIVEVLGYTPEEVHGISPYEWFHPDDIDMIWNENHSKILKGAESNQVEYRAKHKNGHYLWVEMLLMPIRNNEGQLIGLQTSTRNISERKEAELELKKALEKEKQVNELKTQFVSVASHQFRTPLSVIRANMELLEMLKFEISDKATAKVERVISRIQGEVKRLTNMIDDVLILGRLDASKTPFHPKLNDLVHLCGQIISDEFDTEKDARKAELKINGTPKLVWFDESLLFHAITNLLSNAFKYSKGASDPIIELKFENSAVSIAIIDFGIGIESDELLNLFQSFYRGKHVLDIQGTGLGLVIAKEFVEINGGTIQVESKKNKGSKFVINLPYDNQNDT